jgi:hypothetical protein
MWWSRLLSKRLATAITAITAVIQTSSDAWTVVAGVASVACAYIAGETLRPSE